MSDLTFFEKARLERLFGMAGGYALGFTNATFARFFAETAHVQIYDAAFDGYGDSKANRMRSFWAAANNDLVGKVIEALITYGEAEKTITDDPELITECRRISARLLTAGPVPELDVLTSTMDSLDFEAVSEQVRAAIERHQPEAALDRLHTFVVRYVRRLCSEHGITVDQEKPLHSLFGEYVKQLQLKGYVESEMTVRILKSSISVLEAFNDVRNNQSLAHDNAVLNREESWLIFNHVSGLVRFIKALNTRIGGAGEPASPSRDDEDPAPF